MHINRPGFKDSRRYQFAVAWHSFPLGLLCKLISTDRIYSGIKLTISPSVRVFDLRSGVYITHP